MNLNNFTFNTTSGIRFGNGTSKSCASEISQKLGPNILFITDKDLMSLKLTEPTLIELKKLSSKVEVFQDVEADPSLKTLMNAIEIGKKNNITGVIGFGGGSSMDLAKAVALMANHEGDVVDYSVNEGGVGKINETMPMIAIPTTSGTGSEVSLGAVIIMNDGRKLILASDHLRPDAAICDPELTLGLPPTLTAGAGMDALTHCIEAILSPVIDPPAEAVGLDGVEKVVGEESLIRAVKDGQDKEARWNMMMASTEGAMAFSKGLGAVHSMSHAIGADQELRLHHGTLNGVILPTVLRFNRDHVGNKYSKILRAMGKDKSKDLAEEIEILNKAIGLPSGLKEMGITEEMIPGLVAHSMTDPSNATTPRLPTQDEWEKLFLDAM